MLLVEFRAWKNWHILVALVLLSIATYYITPKTQYSKNLHLYDAVVENNFTKASLMVKEGAETNILLPTGYPLISVAIEYENVEMTKLLMLDAEALSLDYKGYRIVDHAAQKKNRKILEMISKSLESR
jgi:hypothetical protein